MKNISIIITLSLLAISCAHRPMPTEIYDTCMKSYSNNDYCMDQVRLDQMDYEYHQDKVRRAQQVNGYIQQMFRPR